MLHAITQRTEVLTSDLISFLYIKVTYNSHLSSQSSRVIVISCRFHIATSFIVKIKKIKK
jgi:hypothetical protein